MSNKEKILNILLDNKGDYVSGEDIANSLQISRNAVWKSISKLKEEGISILSSKKLGYMLPSDLDILSKEEISNALIDELKGTEIHLLNTVDSTNDYAKMLAKQDAPEYTLVVADTQTHGKGRMGRVFSSPSGTGIYMSFILRPKTSLETAQLITSCVAVAISKAIDTLCNCSSKIKWVNDIFLNDKKISGTLTEGAINFENGSFEYAIVGIGINVRSVKNIFDGELSSIATSIEDETGLKISRSRLIAEVFNNVYLQLQSIDEKSFIKEYKKRSLIVGKDVIVSENGQEVFAKAIGIDKTAGLIVQFEDGSTKVLNSGEARIRKY
ncbi:MAG: biotin--[acetyl-CoA-carboxylase] ligase [Ruminococcus sp.]|nr:biotin--[acetyl-CoA-carboxylase] ligase [Ruminococcus sp.]